MLSDEAIVYAVIQYRTAADAAQALGCDPSTIYRRMRTSSAQAIYRSFQADMLRRASEDLNDARDDALTVIRRIMKNRKVNAAVRLQAAQAILSNDLRYAERLAQVETGANDMFFKAGAEAYALKKVKEKKDYEDKRIQEITHRRKGS